MAVIRRIEAQQSFDIGGIPNTQVDDSVGRGLQRVGSAISEHGNAMHQLEMRRIEQKNKLEEFAAMQGFQRFEDDVSADYAEKQVNIDPSGAGFTETVSGIYNSRAEAFMKSVPGHLKPKFADLLATSRNQWVDKAAAAEVDQRNNWYRTGVTERANTLQTQVFNDPAMFDAAKEDAFRTIDASGLPPVEKEALKKKTEEMFSLAVGEREVRDAEADPSRASEAGARLGVSRPIALPKDVQSRANLARDHFVKLGYTPEQAAGIVGNLVQESGVRSDGPSGDKGTAFGMAQWRGERFTRLKRFAASRGRDWKDFTTQLDFIDMELKNHETGAYSRLKSAKTVDEATAAFIGYERPQGWTPNNPRGGHGWANRLAAAQRTAGVAVTAHEGEVDPRYANLSLTQRLTIYDQVQAAAKRGETAIASQQKALYDAEKGALELGIQTGEVVSVQQIMSSNMTDAHKADLLSALRTRQGDNMAISEAIAAFKEGNYKADPYSTDDRKVVDGMYDALEKAVPADQMQLVTEDLIAQSGIVPQKVHNAIRAGLESTVPAEVEAALIQADRIAQINPAILGRREGGSEITKRADDFRHYVNNLNMSPADAAKKIAELNDPQKQRDRKALEPAAKEFRKQIENDDIGAMFDDSILGWAPNPDVGFNEAQRLGIQAEYMAIAEEQFYQVNGNPELAKNRAMEEMKRLYGVTDISGRSVVMKHPPERYWPAMPGSDPYGYVREQVAAELGKFIDDETLAGWFPSEEARQAGLPELRKQAVMDSLMIVATPETDAMIKAGQMPAYFVGYVDPNGNIQTIPGKLFVPDVSGVRSETQRIIDRNIEWAREDDADMRAIQDAPDGGRGAALDSFLDGPTVLPTIKVTPDDTPEAQLKDQRQQLFRDAQDSGVLGPR